MIVVCIAQDGLTVDGHTGYAETMAHGHINIRYKNLSECGKLLVDSFFIGISGIANAYGNEYVRIEQHGAARALNGIRTGMSKMAELRAYYYNGGDMLELVRYQKENIPKAAGCEDIVVSCGQILAQEGKNRKSLGALANLPVYSIPYSQIKKIANIKAFFCLILWTFYVKMTQNYRKRRRILCLTMS